MDTAKFPSETEQKKYILHEKFCRFLMESINHSVDDSLDPILEMSRLNRKDIGAVPFPYNKFTIRIWSNDHNPPHFHVVGDGWDISFLISDGSEYRVNVVGNNSTTYNYIVKNVPIWLKQKSSNNKKITNQEVAEIIWDDYTEELKF